jgi:hypothetical protein
MKNVLTFVWLFFGFFVSIVWLYIQMSIWQPCLKLVNVLIDENGHGRLADFGSSSIVVSPIHNWHFSSDMFQLMQVRHLQACSKN